jgi:hypothetical protein
MYLFYPVLLIAACPSACRSRHQPSDGAATRPGRGALDAVQSFHYLVQAGLWCLLILNLTNLDDSCSLPNC